MDKIIEQIENWGFLQGLAVELEGFRLNRIFKQEGMKYFLFSYCHEEQHRIFTVLYDHATRDFMGRIVFGLTEFIDTTFIVNNLAALEKILCEKMQQTLRRLLHFDKNTLESNFINKKILEWKYGHNLPKQIADFDLFISPCEPLRIINGSYIIIDYSNFRLESNLIIYYNIYRDEFFGEIRINRTPRMTATFDALSLTELEDKLEAHLVTELNSIRHK
ncbi:hypothetical protein P22_3096 [Propionispora sp. 2/2-37]|uniref:hypothetical protein n=1 Tax=Propionispora sp. 2/2-37 TaxID=1677858 RepID=UPI0006BB60B3|nr:hypothetical protein [Propionispora sp. 2/2-37]CUH96975.1 hypothetical protein P22_3096 [Propionispora sp. 2/2-37]